MRSAAVVLNYYTMYIMLIVPIYIVAERGIIALRAVR